MRCVHLGPLPLQNAIRFAVAAEPSTLEVPKSACLAVADALGTSLRAEEGDGLIDFRQLEALAQGALPQLIMEVPSTVVTRMDASSPVGAENLGAPHPTPDPVLGRQGHATGSDESEDDGMSDIRDRVIVAPRATAMRASQRSFGVSTVAPPDAAGTSPEADEHIMDGAASEGHTGEGEGEEGTSPTRPPRGAFQATRALDALRLQGVHSGPFGRAAQQCLATFTRRVEGRGRRQDWQLQATQTGAKAHTDEFSDDLRASSVSQGMGVGPMDRGMLWIGGALHLSRTCSRAPMTVTETREELQSVFHLLRAAAEDASEYLQHGLGATPTSPRASGGEQGTPREGRAAAIAPAIQLLMSGNALEDGAADADLSLEGLAVSQCDLSDNVLTRVPRWVSRRVLETPLVSLDLSHNRVRHLPTSIGRCVSLRQLDVSHNALTALPLALARCLRLQVLRVNDNPLDFKPLELVMSAVGSALLPLAMLRACARAQQDSITVARGRGEPSKSGVSARASTTDMMRQSQASVRSSLYSHISGVVGASRGRRYDAPDWLIEDSAFGLLDHPLASEPGGWGSLYTPRLSEARPVQESTGGAVETDPPQLSEDEPRLQADLWSRAVRVLPAALRDIRARSLCAAAAQVVRSPADSSLILTGQWLMHPTVNGNTAQNTNTLLPSAREAHDRVRSTVKEDAVEVELRGGSAWVTPRGEGRMQSGQWPVARPHDGRSAQAKNVTRDAGQQSQSDAESGSTNAEMWLRDAQQNLGGIETTGLGGVYSAAGVQWLSSAAVEFDSLQAALVHAAHIRVATSPPKEVLARPVLSGLARYVTLIVCGVLQLSFFVRISLRYCCVFGLDPLQTRHQPQHRV